MSQSTGATGDDITFARSHEPLRVKGATTKTAKSTKIAFEEGSDREVALRWNSSNELDLL